MSPTLERFDLSRKIALVTGASSGIGRHIAQTLASAGAKVVVAARRQEEIQHLADEIRSSGGEALPLYLDLTKTKSIEACVDAAAAWSGPISILVNNAGVATTRMFIDQSEEEWQQVLETNFIGVTTITRLIAERMVNASVSGSIINIASVLGLHPAAGVSAYAASKAALLHLTRSLAIELGPRGIRANAIAPGYVQTQLSAEFFEHRAEEIKSQIPLRRFIEATDLDGAILLLASDASSAITGATLVIDAGHSLIY